MVAYYPLLELGSRKTWKMLQLPGLGKLPAHAAVLLYTLPKDALKLIRTNSPWFLSLDGTWYFKILTSPEQVFVEAVNQGAWSTNLVPGD